ncbi:TetR/AcrR family transcriptional regulator [Nocardioides sp. URHA0020]|uniref:TetR/AcrR family transcriptional regulator n=1 Tax=Nocardioides sp. URHA0020 TaxID=1380392 RepID=UPI000684D80A|nr:TetR-like C-terminal domain-containing protein [Nocardioides sp. URHA0020]
MPRAGLTQAVVTEAGADLVDEVGLDHLSMTLLADRLGVRTPSLYKHVTSHGDLAHRIGVLAMVELGDALGRAIEGRAGGDALTAGALAMRRYVLEHPGRYAAGNLARPTGPDDPLVPATDRVLASWAAMLRSYHLEPTQEIHAMRMLRSLLHGFASLESADGFRIDAAVDSSFAWTISFLDHALRVIASVDDDSTDTVTRPRRQP